MRFTTGLISELQALLTECADPKVKELVMDAYYSHSGTEKGVVYVFGGHAIPSRRGGAHKVAAYLYGIGAELGLWERLMDAAPESWRRAGEIDRKSHTSELQSRENLVCRLLLEKKKADEIDLI